MNLFLKGTLILAIASFFGESIEFLVNMVLARELGEHGMGQYMTILPTVFLVVILASLELPISISKFVAEKDRQYHGSMLKHATRLTVFSTVVFVIMAAAVLPLIPIFNHYHPYIRWLVILLIPIISFTSIARGYFMGLQEMGKIAFANTLRKVAQLILLVLLFQWFDFGLETSILIALASFVGSEIIVFLYLVGMYLLQLQAVKRRPGVSMSGKSVRQNLLAVSIPTTALRIFHAITSAIQPFLIKAALVNAGLAADVSTAQFGLMTGVAMSIGFFPAFIGHSLLVVLIPTVSESYSKREIAKLQRLLQQAMLTTFAYGIPAVAFMYFFAEPLTQLFFKSSSATVYLQLLWPYFLFHYFVMPLQAYLIGLGLVKDAFYHSVWSTFVSFLVMYFLGSMAELRMSGIIIGMNTGIILLTMMHYLTICKKIGVSFLLREPVKNLY